MEIGDLQVLKFIDKNDGQKKRLRIIDRASRKWKEITGLISTNQNKADTLWEQCNNRPSDCLRQAFIDCFISNKPAKYSQDWNGIIELLEDVDESDLAGEVKHAIMNPA